MSVHIIWDNSNIWLGGKSTCEELEPGVISSAFRIHFGNLYDFVLNGRAAGHRYFGGSVPPEAEALWGFLKDLGCETSLLHRVGGGEQAVDEVLHLKMSNLVLDIDPPETLALLSGNGHTSEFQSSFPAHVERALKREWEVEIYSWDGSMNHKIYDPIIEAYEKVKYIKLDDYYRFVTFIQEGDYPYWVKGERHMSHPSARYPTRVNFPVER